MAGWGWLFVFCVIGILVVLAVLFGETFIIAYLPNGQATQEVVTNLVIPLEVMLIGFVFGAIVSAFFALRNSGQASEYY